MRNPSELLLLQKTWWWSSGGARARSQLICGTCRAVVREWIERHLASPADRRRHRWAREVGASVVAALLARGAGLSPSKLEWPSLATPGGLAPETVAAIGQRRLGATCWTRSGAVCDRGAARGLLMRLGERTASDDGIDCMAIHLLGMKPSLRPLPAGHSAWRALPSAGSTTTSSNACGCALAAPSVRWRTSAPIARHGSRQDGEPRRTARAAAHLRPQHRRWAAGRLVLLSSRRHRGLNPRLIRRCGSGSPRACVQDSGAQNSSAAARRPDALSGDASSPTFSIRKRARCWPIRLARDHDLVVVAPRPPI